MNLVVTKHHDMHKLFHTGKFHSAAKMKAECYCPEGEIVVVLCVIFFVMRDLNFNSKEFFAVYLDKR